MAHPNPLGIEEPTLDQILPYTSRSYPMHLFIWLLTCTLNRIFYNKLACVRKCSLTSVSRYNTQLNLSRGLFSSVTQLCLFATPWTTEPQASLSITNSQSMLKLMSI